MRDFEDFQSADASYPDYDLPDGYTPWNWQPWTHDDAIPSNFEPETAVYHTQSIEPRESSFERKREDDHLAAVLGDRYDSDSTAAMSDQNVSHTSSQSLPPQGPPTTLGISPVKYSSDQTEESATSLPNADQSSSKAAKDHFLVSSKLSGMSYKQIKTQGNFTEAESTLRGRFRRLTKSKAQRVRKPQWQEIDIQLLRIAVSQLAKRERDDKAVASGNIDPNQVPWKKVAEHIASHGTYHFGNATCRRKWDEINGN